MASPERTSRIRRFVFVWAAGVLGLAIYGFLSPWSHSVYMIYVTASRDWWLRTAIYAVPPHNVVGEPYRYSPLFAIAISPCALLSDGLGNALWRIGICTIYAFGLRAWCQKALPVLLSHACIGSIFLLVLPLSMHSMYNAQANVVVIGAILFALASATTENWNSAAIWLAAATLIKGYPIVVAMLLGAFWVRQFLPRYCVALLSGLAIPFLTAEPSYVWSQYADWFGHLALSNGLQQERIRSLDHLFVLYASPFAPRIWLSLQAAAGLAVLLLCFRYAARFNRREILLTILLLSSVWMVLFGPATETCTYVLVAPAAAWTLVHAYSSAHLIVTRLAFLASFLMMGPLVTDMAGPIVRNFANTHGCQPIGAILFLVCVLVLLERWYRRKLAGDAISPNRVLEAAA
jgi:hypothetical protein